jgi:transposase InsO family protein
VLPIAPSTYFKRKAEERDPQRRSTRAQQDTSLRAIIQRMWNEHHQVYGPRKSGSRWAASISEPPDAAQRLMRKMGLAGAVRDRASTTTTHPGPDADYRRDLVDRHFTATRPNQLWVSDFTYVATW